MSDPLEGVLARIAQIVRHGHAVDPSWTAVFAPTLPVPPATSFAEALATASPRATTGIGSPAGTSPDGSSTIPEWAIAAPAQHQVAPFGRTGGLGVARSAGTANAYVPPLVSERTGPTPYLDCSWAALAMLLAKASTGATPTGSAEVRALRAASGDTVGGSSSADNVRGAVARYGYAPRKVTARAEALELLAHGWGAKLNLDASGLPAALRLDPDFAGGHSVYVQDYDPVAGTLLWLDPLAAAGSAPRRVRLADVDQAVWWDDVLAAEPGSLRR